MLKGFKAIQLIIFVIVVQDSFNPLFAAEVEHTILYKSCIACHDNEHQQWEKSDHAKSMALASGSSIVADFNDTSVSHFGQQAKFYRDGSRFMVDISYNDKKTTYPIKYSFGFYPLQQFLVETESGKLQVLPFSWDSRPADQKGQRWYHNYINEEITPEDRLHWRQPLQNWNGMCADCHSDGLVRNYNVDDNSFSTKYKGINVGCLSCHGDMSEHEKMVMQSAMPNALENKEQQPTIALSTKSTSKIPGHWLREAGQKTAQWQGDKRDNTFMDSCFSCHALRAPLTDGFTSDKSFLDQFTPTLLAAPFYHPDGQIKEEVYVYGSFLQSKMHTEGVNCLDCHDKHTMKVKIEGNGLCLQCHSNDDYNVKEHYQHQDNSSGAQCVNCHMPTTRYMGADDRRDHSFKIPRPDISIEFGTPNACVKCHKGKSNQWALERLTQWNKVPKALSKTQHNYYLLQSSQAVSTQQHLAIVSDEQLDVISRASALELFAYSGNLLTIQQLGPYLRHQEPLLRLAAAKVSSLLPLSERRQYVLPLLGDPLKSIRVAAARTLIDTELSAEDMPLFKQAFIELQNTEDISSWRGEGRLNKGVNAYGREQYTETEKAFIGAIDVDPYFESGYINLADFYQASKRPDKVTEILFKGMIRLPKSAALNYSYGLYLVRQKQHNNATDYFEKAMKLSPVVEQYIYAYVLALDGQDKTVLALEKLVKLIPQSSTKQQLKELGSYLAQKSNNRQMYDWFIALN